MSRCRRPGDEVESILMPGDRVLVEIKAARRAVAMGESGAWKAESEGRGLSEQRIQPVVWEPSESRVMRYRVVRLWQKADE